MLLSACNGTDLQRRIAFDAHSGLSLSKMFLVHITHVISKRFMKQFPYEIGDALLVSDWLEKHHRCLRMTNVERPLAMGSGKAELTIKKSLI